MNEPTYENHIYHPSRKDGLDKNLKKINLNDWKAGVRCICQQCQTNFASSRRWAKTCNLQRDSKPQDEDFSDGAHSYDFIADCIANY